MSKKSELVARLLEKVELPHGVPELPKAGTLLERGMVLALLDQLPPARAEAAVETLRKAYVDWNEARVAQAQELAGHLAGRGIKAPDRVAKLVPTANAIRAYLQEVYQKTHGLDLEYLRGDAAAAAKVVTALSMLGNYLGSVLLWMFEGEQPVTTSVVRVLDRLRLLSRTSSVKKAREAMEPLIPADQALRFAVGFGYVADRWCDPRKPICWECVLVDECATGRKVFREWKLQQERHAAHRVRDEAKRIAVEKKEQARREREAERERRREEALRAKAERERERKAKRAEVERAKPPDPGEGAARKAAKANARAPVPARPAATAKQRSPKDKEPGEGAAAGSKSAPASKAKGKGSGEVKTAPKSTAPKSDGGAKPSRKPSASKAATSSSRAAPRRR